VEVQYEARMLDRRTVLAGSASLLACGPAGVRAPRVQVPGPTFSESPFAFGVASGDPTADGVVLWTALEVAEHLFRIAVGPLRDRGGLLTAAGDQGIALLLGLLAELQGIVVQALGLHLAVALHPQTFLADGLQLLHRLLPAALVLLHQHPVAFRRLALQLLAPGLGLLLELLPAHRELLLQLGHPGLQFLLRLGGLLAGLDDRLLALQACLLPHLRHMPLRLMADRGVGDQLLPLATGGGHDLLGLLAGLLHEAVALADQLVGMGDLAGQRLPQRIHHLDGVLLVDEAPAAEGDATAVQDDVLELVQLIENGDADL
jgi:hypothetical protein